MRRFQVQIKKESQEKYSETKNYAGVMSITLFLRHPEKHSVVKINLLTISLREFLSQFNFLNQTIKENYQKLHRTNLETNLEHVSYL